ncbi:MAG TPA: ArdC-like ssDNA-binding domain-containing protein [Herpetosiphonaceae bacterium]
MATKHRRTYTADEKHQFAEERQAKLDGLAKQLESGIAAIQSSDTFTAYLRTAAKFHRYSFSNAMLIWQQRPAATYVAGYHTWRELGRQVRKGEIGLRIFAPMKFKTTDPKTGEATGRTGFKATSVFDVSQTEGEPLPELDIPLLTGDEGADVYAALVQFAQAEGLTITNHDANTDGDDSRSEYRGYYLPKQRLIFVKQNPQQQMLDTLIHELGHYLDPTVLETTADVRETIAEATAFIVAAHFGIDTSAKSFPYIADWAGKQDGTAILKRVLDRIQKIAKRLIDAAEQGMRGELETAPAPTAAPSTTPAPVLAVITPRPPDNLIAKLRSLADALTPQIDAKRTPAIANQRMTTRRAGIAESMAREADRLARIQSALYGLANAHQAGTIPATLRQVTTKAQVESLLDRATFPSGTGWEQERRRLEAAGITAATFADAKAQLVALCAPVPTLTTAQQQIRQLERSLIGTQIPGYFPTPRPVVEQMIAAADLAPGLRVLEPSAGSGHIADAIREAAEVELVVIEQHYTLQQILELKGHQLIASDFLAYHQDSYDRILMNPPFERGQDMQHVQHAYRLLKPGGRLIAIMSEGPFFRDYQADRTFRAWLDDVDGQADPLPAGSFYSSDRPTGVHTRLVIIDKPAEARIIQIPAPRQLAA